MSNYVLAIGIDDYTYCTKLNNAVRDINNVVATLTKKYDFEKSNVITLINKDASFENIINNLEILIAQQTAGDNLLILFSGHGEYDDALEMGYIIPCESKPHSKATFIPYSRIFSYIRVLKSHHILLISDSCFSGSVFSPIRSIQTTKDKLDKIPSKWAITSGRIEPVSDGKPGKNSPFAEALLKVLNDDSDDELLSVSELSNRIISEVAEKLDQIPRGEPLQMYGHKGGEFIFRKKNNNKKYKPSKSNDREIKELLALIDANYEIDSKIEEAENGNMLGTLKRLTKEKKNINQIIERELLKVLEIKRNDILKSVSMKKLLSKEFLEKYDKLLDFRNEKLKFVKYQQFESAAAARDTEIQLCKELNSSINNESLEDDIKLSTKSIFQDYAFVQIILDSRINKNEKEDFFIENIFVQILFLDLSFENGHISQYIYHEDRQKLVSSFFDSILKRRPLY